MKHRTYIPKLEDYMKALEQNRVFSCEDEHFIGFKYNDPTTYSRDWDDVTLNARGIAFDKKTGEIVARPFFKFFNYQELINGNGEKTEILEKSEAHGFHFNAGLKFRVMDKLDGSLGIIFWNKYDKKWQVKTGGSFNSDQAVWAQKWFDEHVDTSIMYHNLTYCVEILCDADLHPISYDKEELVLLSVILNATGEELPLEDIQKSAKHMGIRTADIIEFQNFDEVIPYATALPKDKEGVVVTFENGFKVKLKGKEFLDLQRIFHSYSEKTIWEKFSFIVKAEIGHDSYGEACRGLLADFLEYIEKIPEEMPDLAKYADNLTATFFADLLACKNTAMKLTAEHTDRKEIWEAAQTETEKKYLLPAVMGMVSTILKMGKENVVWEDLCTTKVKETIYRALKP